VGTRSSLLGDRVKAVLPPILLTLAIIAVWELAIPILNVSKFMLARPSEIGQALLEEAGLFTDAAITTSGEVLFGFLLSVVVGVAIALMLTRFDWLDRALYPLVVVFQVVPKVALAPLLILWFGFGDLPKILLIMFIAFFPITLNMRAGLESVDPNLLLLMRSVGATRSQVLMQVQIPASLPYLFAGLRIAVTFSVIGAVVAEFAGANKGLGYLIQYESTQLDTPLLFAGLVAISGAGFAFYLGLSVIERIARHWYPNAEVETKTG
jgi:ABC-type nitrate/sulfonate/bicarbonate transport system, permease component